MIVIQLWFILYMMTVRPFKLIKIFLVEWILQLLLLAAISAVFFLSIYDAFSEKNAAERMNIGWILIVILCFLLSIISIQCLAWLSW